MKSTPVTVIVPLDYASDVSKTKLSPASIETLSKAINFLNHAPVKKSHVLICGNTQHPKQRMNAVQARTWRKAILDSLRENTSYQYLFTLTTNSIDEAENIKQELFWNHLSPKAIHVFCDRYHAGRTELIWGHFFPDTRIIIHKVRCPWGRKQAQFIQRNTLLWAVANYVSYFIMKVRGVENIRNIK